MCPNMFKHQFFVLSTEDTPTSIDISIADDLYCVVMGRHVSKDPAKDHRVWWSGASKQFDAGWALVPVQCYSISSFTEASHEAATWFEVDKSSLPLLVWTSRTMQNGARQFMFKQTYLMVSTYWKHLTTWFWASELGSCGEISGMKNTTQSMDDYGSCKWW